MAIDKLPSGTRGARTPPRLLMRALNSLLPRIHRRTGDRMGDNVLLYLKTIGARSGAERTNPVARFDDGAGGWFVVASFGGAAQHPAWYHNIAAHPDQVRAEVAGTTHRVEVQQLEGAEYDAAWQQITRQAPQFDGYLAKTDRTIPVLRLTPVS